MINMSILSHFTVTYQFGHRITRDNHPLLW